MMENEKRLLIAIALSVLVILGYQSYVRKVYKPNYSQPVNQELLGSVVEKSELPDYNKENPAAPKDEDTKEQEQPKEEKLVKIENELYRATLTDNGAAVKELYLLKFKDKGNNPVSLFHAAGKTPFILETEDTIKQQGAKWHLAQQTDETIIYRAEDDQKVIEKKFKFHNSSYIIELEINIQNKTSYPQEIRYKVIGAPALVSGGQIDKRYMGVDAQIEDKIYRRSPSSKSIQGGEVFYGAPAWASARGRYFSFVLKPGQKEEAAFAESRDKTNAWSGVMLGPVKLSPNETITHKYTLYAGPNSADAMAAIGAISNNVISYGMFNSIARLLFKGLSLFYTIFGNYGVAIIMLSILISAAVFPLTRKSLRSMKEMQKVQPEVERIRKEHSDNPQKMNKEIMELYKTHKINPLGGCFPMFLQLPIFLSLYNVLLRSVELKGAHFLWIKDLSEPDALFTLKQTFPIMQDKINLLPILMAVAMFVQQKVSHPGGEVSEQQKIMATIMPIMFCVIFYNLPSGLVLYWFTNTLITLLVQEVILKSRQQV